MAKKSHLKFISEKQLSEVKEFRYNYGFDSDKDLKEDRPKNYTKLATSFKEDLEHFDNDLAIKYRLKDRAIHVPHDIDFVQISFFGQFFISKYFKIYYSEFGLEATSFYDFAKKGLFAISDREKFQLFISQINAFIETELGGNDDQKYSDNIRYISGFKLLKANDILKFRIENIGDVVYLSLMHLPLDEKIKMEVVQALTVYIEANSLHYRYDAVEDRIELIKPTAAQIQKILQNFDIIESATCSAFTTVKPGAYNTVQRNLGFNIVNPDEDLPVVGIIDTGISQETVLGSLIVKDATFTLAGNPLIDQAGRNRLGHGTAVAGLVALGRDNHRNGFEGEVLADAKLLSIKISDGGNGYVSEFDLLKMLYEVKTKYPEIRLFTLTTCYGSFMHKNEAFSDYTYSLDKFAYETNSLIFICTGNNENCINENTSYDLAYFHGDHTNLSTPADSLNNITVGAAADNLKNGVFLGISSGREFPALYTRKGHIDLSAIYNAKKTNKNYFKPDVIESGGDVGYYNATTLDFTDAPALTLLSARPEIGLTQEAGTSFATPLVANLAAKIVKNYPALSNESIKALIINAASLNRIPFTSDASKLRNRVAGNGLVDDFRSLYSDENSATLILEDEIENGRIRIYPVNFPAYLAAGDLDKVKKRLKITATLCFKFLPIKNNQLSYNPVHMAFSLFKNHSADEIMSAEDKEAKLTSKLRSNLSWSENGRYVSKPLPYSNTQKITLNVNVDDLTNESNTFKLALHARLSEQIVGGVPENYPRIFPFSIVLTIEEALKSSTGKLYDEIQLVNQLEVIQDISLDTRLEAEALDV